MAQIMKIKHVQNVRLQIALIALLVMMNAKNALTCSIMMKTLTNAFINRQTLKNSLFQNSFQNLMFSVLLFFFRRHAILLLLLISLNQMLFQRHMTSMHRLISQVQTYLFQLAISQIHIISKKQ